MKVSISDAGGWGITSMCFRPHVGGDWEQRDTYEWSPGATLPAYESRLCHLLIVSPGETESLCLSFPHL